MPAGHRPGGGPVRSPAAGALRHARSPVTPRIDGGDEDGHQNRDPGRDGRGPSRIPPIPRGGGHPAVERANPRYLPVEGWRARLLRVWQSCRVRPHRPREVGRRAAKLDHRPCGRSRAGRSRSGNGFPKEVDGCAVISSIFTSGLRLPGQSSCRAASQTAGGAGACKRAGRRGPRWLHTSRRTGERAGLTDRRGRCP